MSDEPPMIVTPVTFDRTVNLPFLVTVVAAIMAGAVWTSNVNARLDELDGATSGMPEMRERIARMDERGEATKATLTRIERQLDGGAPRH
jgi:hypothetical protein